MLLTGAATARLAHDVGLFDHVEVFDDESAYHGQLGTRAALFARVARRVRALAPDVVAVMKAAAPWIALARVSGAPVRAGIARGRAARMLTQPIFMRPGEHWEDRYDAVASALRAPDAADVPESAKPEWATTGLDPEAYARLATARAGGRTLIGLAPGGARNVRGQFAPKRWPASHYAALATELLRTHPRADVVLLGAASDRGDADAVAGVVPGARLVDLVGQTTLAGTRGAIAALDLFVGNDSSLLHIAATTPTSTVAIFGPTDPRALCPRRASVQWLWRPARATACHDEITGAQRPCVTPCCIEGVTVDDAFRAACVALARDAVPR